MTSTSEAVLLGACRTPVGSFLGALAPMSAAELGAIVVRESLRRSGMPAIATDGVVDDVVMGCVLQAGAGMNVARQAAIRAGLPVTVPAETVNRVCGSGLQAVVHAAASILLGHAGLVVAGGTESMSNAPFLAPGVRSGLRLGHATLIDSMLHEGLTCALESCHMGITAETVAERLGVTRDDQDEFAARSQRRAEQAIAEGIFADEIVPVDVPQRAGAPVRVDTDEHPRAGTTAERLGRLRPAFTADGTVTAGNASGINDGASAMVVTTAARAERLGVSPLGRLVAHAVTGVEPIVMGMGPVAAVRSALSRAHLSAEAIDLWELNEAFAAQSVAVVRELGLDEERVNVNRGAIALGHPIGASGARILTTLLHALRARGGGRGVASLCIGGGMGIAVVVETL